MIIISVAKKPELSILIVNFNAQEKLRLCLDSIRSHRNSIVLEIIVVDNASSDGSVDMIKSRYPDVKLVIEKTNQGYTKGNNTAIKIANSELALLLNNDTEVLPGALECLIDFISNNPKVGAVAPKVLNSDMSIQGTVKSLPTPLSALFGRKTLLTRLFPNNRFSKRHLLYLGNDFGEPFEVGYASTAALLVRKSILDDIGGFDTDFFVYWSDADLGRRIKNRGWLVYCEPKSIIFHHEHSGGTNVNISKARKSIVDFNRGAYIYYRKHHVKRTISVKNIIAIVGLAANTIIKIVMFELSRLKG